MAAFLRLLFYSGAKRNESSILTAYLSLIDAAEHFIYIENQFFISSITGVQTTFFERCGSNVAVG